MVVHAYYPLAEPRVQREAHAARDAGYEVTVLALRGENEPSQARIDGVLVRRLPIRHVRGASLARIAWEYLAFCALATAWLMARPRRFDVIHVHNPPDVLIGAGLLPRALGARLVLDVHDLSSHIFGVRFRGLIGATISQVLVWLERAACRLADAVVTVHKQYRDELVRRGTRSTKVTVVMNSLDDALLERASRNSPIVAPREGFRIAYHGTLTWWYGADLIVEALGLLRDHGVRAQAVLLGGGDAVPDLMERVRSAGLEGDVFLPGRYVPIEVALATVTGSSCGVIPNRPSRINRFALSSKLFEYVALGIPAVVARLETLAAHFAEDEVTFFEPGNAAALSAALRWVHDNPSEALQKAERARTRAREYSWSHERQVLWRLYEELLGGRTTDPELSQLRRDCPRRALIHERAAGAASRPVGEAPLEDPGAD